MRCAFVVVVALWVAAVPTVDAQSWGDCAGIPGNLVGSLNCDFGDGVNHWTFSSLMGTWTTTTLTGYPTQPSASAEASDPGDYSFTITSECLPVTGGTDYTMGLYANTPGGASINCSAHAVAFLTADCSGLGAASPDAPFTPATNLWTAWETTWQTSPGSQSAMGVLVCSADASFTVLFDNLAMVEGTAVPVVLQRFTVE